MFPHRSIIAPFADWLQMMPAAPPVKSVTRAAVVQSDMRTHFPAGAPKYSMAQAMSPEAYIISSETTTSDVTWQFSTTAYSRISPISGATPDEA